MCRRNLGSTIHREDVAHDAPRHARERRARHSSPPGPVPHGRRLGPGRPRQRDARRARGERRPPPWFRAAGDGLAELSNAPDRWREVEKGAPALAARRPDHFFDLDVWGVEPLPSERWAYVARAARRRLSAPAVGFLPFAIGEEYGVLLSAFRDVRSGRPGAREGALAAAG